MTDTRLEASYNGTTGGFRIDLDFAMPLEGITALFGASGSGKTSILRAIAGLSRLDGSLKVGGDVWQDDKAGVFLPPHKRSVGYVFQEASLFPHLTVRDNLLYGQKRIPTGGSARLDIDDVAALMDIAPLQDRHPATLSGGERQRVAIGRALLRAPRLLLMDEPVSALDQRGRDKLLRCLDQLHKDLTLPILYVSHDTAEVARLADHTVLISNGRKLAEGPTRDIFERLDILPPGGSPEASVLLEAVIVAHDPISHLTHLRVGEHDISIPHITGDVGSTVMLRVRARDVAIATTKPEGISIRNILAGTISDMREDTASPYVELLVDIGGGHVRAQVTHDACADLALHEGQQVHALVKSMSLDGAGR